MNHTPERFEPIPDFAAIRPSDRPTGFHRALIQATPAAPVRVRRGKLGRLMQKLARVPQQATIRLTPLTRIGVRGLVNRRSPLPFG